MDFAEVGISFGICVIGSFGLAISSKKICNDAEWSPFALGFILLALIVSVPLLIRSLCDVTASNIAENVYAAAAANMVVPWFILIFLKHLRKMDFHPLEIVALCLGPSLVSILAMLSYVTVKEAIVFEIFLTLCITVPHILTGIKWPFPKRKLSKNLMLVLLLFIVSAMIMLYGSDMFIESVPDLLGSDLDQMEIARIYGASAAFLQCGTIVFAYLFGKKETAPGIAFGCMVLNLVFAIISVYCLPYELF